MSTVLTGPVQVASQTLHSSSADKYHNLGDTVFANDGRAFRYCKAGSTALVAGKLQQSSAEDTGLQNLTAVAASAGDLSIAASTTVTVTANEYAEGFILVTVTPGVGRVYKVKGHTAYTAAAPTFNTFDSVAVALTTTSRLDAVRNLYSAVIVAPTTFSSAPTGVAIHPIAAGEFGWLQVGGVASVLADGANAVGVGVVTSNGVAGAVEDAAAPVTQATLVGVCVTGVADTEYGAVKLQGLL
jgi:hypothetical protein